MEKLKENFIHLYNSTHPDVVKYYTEDFPMILAVNMKSLGVLSYTFKEKELQANFEAGVDITDIYIIMKALDYNVTIDNINLTITVSI